MKPVSYANVDTDPASITPLYDNLLVRRLEEQEYKGLLVLPGMTQTEDGRWVRQQDVGPRRGVVVARGRGDKTDWHCTLCSALSHEPEPDELVTCPKCGTDGCSDRSDMDVQVGDIIIYPRFESSHMLINGVQHTFVREGDVMAVVEADGAWA